MKDGGMQEEGEGDINERRWGAAADDEEERKRERE